MWLKQSIASAHWVGVKKLQKLDDFKKFAVLKKGIGIESQKTIQTT